MVGLFFPVLRWVVTIALGIWVVVQLRYLYGLLRVRRQVSRIIHGIPLWTASRLWEIQKNRPGGYGRRIFHHWSPYWFVAVYTGLGALSCAMGAVRGSTVLFTLALALLLTALDHAMYTATPPMVLYLAPSSFAAHQTQWKIAQELRRALGPCRVISMLDPGALQPKKGTPMWAWDLLFDLTFRMGEVKGDDWFSALWWLMDIVPVIVVNLSGWSEDTVREIESIFDRGLAPKTFFIIDPDSEASPYTKLYKRRLGEEPWRFLPERTLIDRLVAMLAVAGRTGTVLELGIPARRTR